MSTKPALFSSAHCFQQIIGDQLIIIGCPCSSPLHNKIFSCVCKRPSTWFTGCSYLSLKCGTVSAGSGCGPTCHWDIVGIFVEMVVTLSFFFVFVWYEEVRNKRLWYLTWLCLDHLYDNFIGILWKIFSQIENCVGRHSKVMGARVIYYLEMQKQCFCSFYIVVLMRMNAVISMFQHQRCLHSCVSRWVTNL